MLAAVLCFAILDAVGKHLAQTFPVPMLVWARYNVHLLLMLLFLAPTMRGRLLASRRPALQVVRGLMLVGVTSFAIAAFRHLPLGETTALLFISPLIVALLARPLLGETVGAGRWLAILGGFAGALLIARPGGAINLSGLLLVFGAALCYSIYQIQTRMLSPGEHPVTMVFYTALTGSIASSLAAPLFWSGPAPDWRQALLIASLGVCGGVGHYFLARAFRLANASTLSPFLYVQLLWAALLGGLFFEHWPDAVSLIGMFVIAVSSVAMALMQSPRSAPKTPDQDRDKAC